MKKIYLMPQTEIVNVRLMGSVLEDPNLEGHNYSIVTDGGDAKESSFDEEEGLINPTQPNLWDDNEEE
jgi:hypothetical protein